MAYSLEDKIETHILGMRKGIEVKQDGVTDGDSLLQLQMLRMKRIHKQKGSESLP